MREREGSGGADPSTSRTDPDDAFTYLTCNNLEKVLTIARGSPRSSERREGVETRMREETFNEPSAILEDDRGTSENVSEQIPSVVSE